MSLLFKSPEEKHLTLISNLQTKKKLVSVNKKSKVYVPKSILLQWHLTERCNLRCSHCYQEEYSSKELSYNECKKVINQFKELIKYFSKNAQNKIHGHITVTGGEPFVRKDFFKILNLLHKNNKHFSYAILTNGTFIDEKVAKELSQLNPAFVQISIEGRKETHDSIRGKGNYEKAIIGLKNLVKYKVPSIISFTAHKKNYTEFEDVSIVGKEIGVNKIWSDRLIPCGSGTLMEDLLLSPAETKKFFEIMKETKTKSKNNSKTEVSMHRALQFLVGGGKPYQCSAANSLITVQSNGDLVPCRRMPIVVGNVLKESIKEMYYKSEIFNELRNIKNINSSCKSCIYSNLCRGGLKCLSFATTKNPFSKDPGCWL
jgi:radical SAM protein with 4Fe4S-binding SPASM domain